MGLSSWSQTQFVRLGLEVPFSLQASLRPALTASRPSGLYKNGGKPETMSARLTGKWLITGGSGFLGRAIIKRALEESWDCDFTVFSRDEQKQDTVRRKFPNVKCLLGDIFDTERLELAMTGHDGVIHAGALKYIPEAEFNTRECVRVNLMGSMSVITAARTAHVEACIAISTDKAVMPLNVYGATKFLMERAFVEADLESIKGQGPRYGVVRYGNVIGSTGSIIPVLLRSAATRNYVDITDATMTRFWMDVDEAIDLILYNAELLANGRSYGEVIISEARSMQLGDLVDTIIPPEITRNVIGRRPGEKMHECLVSAYEATKVMETEGEYVHFNPLVKEGKVKDYAEYRSDDPSEWLSSTDLKEAIEAADKV